MKLHFLYGTETGNSEMLCEDIEAEIGGGFETAVTCFSDFAPSDLDVKTFYFIVTSTYGSGDLPTNTVPFYDTLAADKPDLKGLQFAVFGLGDMVFAETFNQGSQKMMELFLACGAQMIGERGLYDASTAEMPEDTAVPWAQDILTQLQSKAA
ncbi:MAG: flavodoxin domain-containing protein [Paracoccaceae bacterium]